MSASTRLVPSQPGAPVMRTRGLVIEVSLAKRAENRGPFLPRRPGRLKPSFGRAAARDSRVADAPGRTLAIELLEQRNRLFSAHSCEVLEGGDREIGSRLEILGHAPAQGVQRSPGKPQVGGAARRPFR